MRIGIYPGSFDPITLGHLNIIERAALRVDKLFVAVVANHSKIPLFDIHERMEMIRRCVRNIRNVSVDHFNGLLVAYARKKNAGIIFKGLRAVSDFEIEFQMALVNRELEPRVETVFLMTGPQYAFLSSSLVKEVASLGGSVKGMVPDFIESKLKEKFRGARMLRSKG